MRRGKQSLLYSAPRIARDREKGRCLWSPGLLGGLAGGRVRSRDSRGIPKKRSCSLNFFLGLRVLTICNTTTGENVSLKNSPFRKLQNLLFQFIPRRVRFSYKSQLFFNDSENHIKSSLRSRLAFLFDFALVNICPMCFINICKRHFFLIPLSNKIIFFESLENSKTSVKPM